jgi:hypothetical protein
LNIQRRYRSRGEGGDADSGPMLGPWLAFKGMWQVVFKTNTHETHIIRVILLLIASGAGQCRTSKE